ncbi:hypothetical protein J2W35_001323 [Variovorax boronicumulans]|uniref:hypothetical protein n=1 Tax=Variovorax boronicumulans TaxID=436515 RepID=UPI00277EFA8A|nr:hypothetical protein [Variovorax boronicumulans]MDQ0080986.1 hypothetical protein [Variovorax boronicumulans]
MKTSFRIERRLLEQAHCDLSRPHPYAHERVGFIACSTADVQGGLLLLADEYLLVADEDYVNDRSVGAMMGPAAIRKALEYAYGRSNVAMLHVHRHEHRGVPGFSKVDLSESAKFVPDFWKVRPGVPHGIVVLSFDAMNGLVWDPTTQRPQRIEQMAVIGRPMSIFGRWWRK